GNYRLDGEQFDFRGHARFDVKLSHMVLGWESFFLKPVDPFFSKNGAGADLPVRITGTKSETHFSLDLFDEKNKPVEKARVRHGNDGAASQRLAPSVSQRRGPESSCGTLRAMVDRRR